MYAKEPVELTRQILALANAFELDATHALKFSQGLPSLRAFVPEEALPWTKYFAILHVHGKETGGSPKHYCGAVRKVHKKMSSFVAHEEDLLEYAEFHPATISAYQTLAEQQKGGILIIAAQLGMYHRGRCTRDTCTVLAKNEFGIGTLAVGSIILTESAPLTIGIDCAGDRINRDTSSVFLYVPSYRMNDRGVRYGYSWEGEVGERYGSATGFLIP